MTQKEVCRNCKMPATRWISAAESKSITPLCEGHYQAMMATLKLHGWKRPDDIHYG